VFAKTFLSQRKGNSCFAVIQPFKNRVKKSCEPLLAAMALKVLENWFSLEALKRKMRFGNPPKAETEALKVSANPSAPSCCSGASKG
jgi:hypothetical protein